MKRIQLSDHFKLSTILLFSLPSIGMQIVDNAYQVADGYFISNYIGEAAFEAENLIFPPLLIVMYVGLMFGSGASALISRELGEGHRDKANRILSMAVLALAVIGVVISGALYFLLPAVARWVGASDGLIPDCVTYGKVLSLFMPFQMLSIAFHPLLITSERPGLGLVTTVANAAANIFLDWLFVAVFGWGMKGAAVATGLAWLVSAVIPAVYFANRTHTLHFTRPALDLAAFGQTLYNGASEMVDAVAYAVVALIFNLQMLRYLGEAGVGAYAVSEYVGGLFSAVFYGVSMSIVPVVGYHLGKQNAEELHSLRRNGLLLMGLFGLAMTGLCLAMAGAVSRFFVGYNEELSALAAHALRIVSLSFLLGGITTYSTSYFTGLNQGGASLIIAAVKGFVGPLAAVWLLPLLIGVNGLWLSLPFAELLTLIVVIVCFFCWNRHEDQKLKETSYEDEGIWERR